MFRVLVVAVLSCVLCACSLQDEEIVQTINGRLIVDGRPPSGELKVLSWRNGDCSAYGVASSLGDDGSFKMSRTVIRGRIAVVVQHDLICFRGGGEWEVVWQSGPYGPSARSLAIDCAKASTRWKCSVVTDWGVDIARPMSSQSGDPRLRDRVIQR